MCEGKITRRRVTVNNIEESIIDYIIVCQEMFMFMISMKVDANNVLTSFSKKKITPSDHRLMVAKFNFPWSNKKMKQNLRYEILKMQKARKNISK